LWTVDLTAGEGEFRAAMVCARARLKEARPVPGEGPPPRLSEGEAACYTLDEEMLRLDRTAQAAQAVATDAAGPDAKARAIYQYVVQNLRYDRDGRWDPADVVLRRGTGSCTEMAYVFVSLCRNLGIPARMVWAATERRPAEVAVDALHHTWAEYHSPATGWTPVDCSRGLSRPDDYFGRQDANVLAAVGDASLGRGAPHARPWQARVRGQGAAAARVSVWIALREPAAWDEAVECVRAWEGRPAATCLAEIERLGRERPGLALAVGLYALAHPSDEVFEEAGRRVAMSGIPGALTALVHFRDVAGERPRGGRAQTWLRQAATEGSSAARAQAIRDLAAWPCSTTEEAVLLAVGDREATVRAAAAAALGKVGRSAASRAALERLRADPDAAVAQAAESAVSALNAAVSGGGDD
jgi:hypothetical protein